MITLARHVRPDGQPRRLWMPAPAAPPSEPMTLSLPAVVLNDVDTLVLHDRLARNQWEHFRHAYGVIGPYERTYPRRYIARRLRRFRRRLTLAGRVLFNVAFVIAALGTAAIVGGPFAYGLGL